MSLILDALKRSETEQKMTPQISVVDEPSIDRKRFPCGAYWMGCVSGGSSADRTWVWVV
jgi:hypothetical protein